jgi:hypothetical protein
LDDDHVVGNSRMVCGGLAGLFGVEEEW